MLAVILVSDFCFLFFLLFLLSQSLCRLVSVHLSFTCTVNAKMVVYVKECVSAFQKENTYQLIQFSSITVRALLSVKQHLRSNVIWIIQFNSVTVYSFYKGQFHQTSS